MYSPVREAVKLIFKVSPDPPRLPVGAHGETHVFRASRSYWRYRMLGYALGMLFFGLFTMLPAGGVLFASFQGNQLGWGPNEGMIAKIIFTIVLLFYVGMGAVWYAVVRLDYEFRWYIVTERSLRIRQGIGTFEETTLTFANVQNAEILQGPLERAFGFANVLVETAGGGGPPVKGQPATGWHKGLIRGLDDASRVRDLIRAAIARHGGAGLGDKDDRSTAPLARPAAPVALVALSPALREVLDETAALRRALEARAGGSP